MMNQNTWSEVVFSFDPSPFIIAGAIGAGGAMGVFGGLMPAVRAARVSPIAAMRGE
jgi:putative ABC transport system permease protein